MSVDELLDLVNEDDEVLGTVWKSEAHGDPKLIHREIAVTVFSKKGKVLLQQRSMKKTHPGEWKVTASGHVGAGEDPKVACAREVKEELGLDVEPIFFDKQLVRREDKELRFFYIYYAVLDGEVSPTLDEDEVMDARWVPISELENFSKDNDYDLNGLSHQIIMKIAKHLGL